MKISFLSMKWAFSCCFYWYTPNALTGGSVFYEFMSFRAFPALKLRFEVLVSSNFTQKTSICLNNFIWYFQHESSLPAFESSVKHLEKELSKLCRVTLCMFFNVKGNRLITESLEKLESEFNLDIWWQTP